MQLSNKILQIFNENFEGNSKFSLAYMRIVEAFIRVELTSLLQEEPHYFNR